MKKKSTPLKDFVKKTKKRNSKMKKEIFKTDFIIQDSNHLNTSNIQIQSKTKRIVNKKLKVLDENLKEENNFLPKKNEQAKLESLINLYEVGKNCSKKCSNIEIILSIIEVVRNKEYYNLSSSEKSNQFWENAKEKFLVFSDFKSETLRKYWRPISGNIEKTIDFLKLISSIKGVELIKLLPLLNFIQKHLDEENEFIISELNILIQKENKVENKDYLKKKRAQKKDLSSKQDDDEFTIKLVHVNTNINNETINENKKQIENRVAIKKEERLIKEIKTQKTNDLNDKDKDKYDCISEIVETLLNLLKDHNYTRDDIIDALEKNSMNIVKSYDYLNEKNEDIIFTKNEDYIITHLKDTPQYKSILEIKGKEAVEARIEFLNKI